MPPKKSRAQSEPDPFTRQELDRFLAAAHESLSQLLSLVLETMAMTGLRVGEVLAMRRQFLDVHNCQYYVTGTTRNGRFGPPKSGRQDLFLSLSPAFPAWRKASNLLLLLAQAIPDLGFLDFSPSALGKAEK